MKDVICSKQDTNLFQYCAITSHAFFSPLIYSLCFFIVKSSSSAYRCTL